MATSNGAVAYIAACQKTFSGRPEHDRMGLYGELALRHPRNPVHAYRLARACLDGGSLELWRQGVELALALPHDSPRSRCDRGDARLRLGIWDAWQDLEWRVYDPEWGVSHASWLSWTQKRWDGEESLSGKQLLVTHLGGFGDAIWSMQFVEALADRVGHVLWDTSPALHDFVQRNIGHLVEVASIGFVAPGVAFDRYMLAMSLPRLTGIIPPFVRRAASVPRASMASPTRRPTIGLVWACSPEGLDHLERSMPLSMLAPFFWRRDIEWVSLQIGPRASDADYYPGIRRVDPPPRTFMDTANVLSALDGVITVDTSVCHLAGVLGVPTLTLLRFVCDAKWGLDETVAWYPTMRLIRQSAPGEWGSVVHDVQTALDSRWWLAVHNDPACVPDR